MADDLERLKQDYPDWAIGTGWAMANSGPDLHFFWARRDGVMLYAWSPSGLREQMLEARIPGCRCPLCMT